MSGKNKAVVAAILESLQCHARRPNVLPPLLSASIITETEGGQEKRKRDSAGKVMTVQGKVMTQRTRALMHILSIKMVTT